MTPQELVEKFSTIPMVFVDWMFKELRAMQIGESLSPSKEKNRENFILIGKYVIQFECFRHLGWDFLFSNDYAKITKMKFYIPSTPEEIELHKAEARKMFEYEVPVKQVSGN